MNHSTSDATKQQRLLSAHTSKKIKEFNQNDSAPQQTAQILAKKTKQEFVSVKVPGVLQGIADNVPYNKVIHNPLPQTLVTSRLKPTAELPQVYRDGLVEGNNACWRDVSLRGFIPGPITRLSQIHQKEETQNLTLSQIDVNTEDQQQQNGNQIVETNLDVSGRIGQLMRQDINNIRTPKAVKVPEKFYPDKASVNAVIEAIRLFDSENPGYQVDVEMKKVISQIQKDIYNLREHCLTQKDFLATSQGKELQDRIQACRQILLMDMNDGFLNLEDFDATDAYEIHSPEEWFEFHTKQFIFPDGKEILGIPAYSRYLYKDRLALEPCVVTGYNPEHNVWVIQWLQQNTQQFAHEGSICVKLGCELIQKLNNIEHFENNFRIFTTAPALVSDTEKSVKRLNLLFADEDERMWWDRRWQAHYSRRKVESQSKMEIFLDTQFDQAIQIKEYMSDRTKVLDFKITQLLELLSDVAGPTAEIIDNIFHSYVLDNESFYKFFLQKLDEDSYNNVIKLSGQLVQQVTENLIKSNMLAVLEYLRRDPQFNSKLTNLGINPPTFIQRKVFTREIATVAQEFQKNIIFSLLNFAKRRARINTISLSLSNQYKPATDFILSQIQEILILNGLYYFNFAGIIPFLATDQIELIKSGFAGGIMADSESFSIQLSMQNKVEEVKQEDQIIKKGGIKIRVQNEKKAEVAPELDLVGELGAIPFYAHPQIKNLRDLGVVSPGLPLSLEQFTFLADGHRERMTIYLQDLYQRELSSVLAKKLKQNGIDVNCLSSDMEYAVQNVVCAGSDGCDKYSYEKDVEFEQSGLEFSQLSNCNDACFDRPRQRTLVDLEDFCRLINYKFYDTIMHISDKTSEKFMEMLNQFKVTNYISYDECLQRTKNLIKLAKTCELSNIESGKLLKEATTPLFRTCTSTTVDNCILKIFINVEPYIREMRQVSSQDAHYIPPSNQEFFNDIDNFKNITSQLVTEAPKEDNPDQRLTYDHYYAALKSQNAVCLNPCLVNLECSLLPSIDSIHNKILEIYESLLNVSSQIKSINTAFPCLEHRVKNTTLPGPNSVHDPWLGPRYEELNSYLNDTAKGPNALFSILQLIIKRLFFTDKMDYVEIKEDVYDYEAKILPPLDEFNDIDTLENDITNKEDEMLITCKNWDYVFEKKVEKIVIQAEKDIKFKQQNSDEEEEEEIKQEEELIEKEVKIVVNNTNLSLRDLRCFLQCYTAIREFLKQLAPPTQETVKDKSETVCKISFGLYSIDITNVIDILTKRANILRAQVIRIIQQRLVKRSQNIIDDWKLIQEKMNTECKTPGIFAEIKQFLANIHMTIESMRGKQIILDRYMSVCEEFGTQDKDFLRILHQQYSWFSQRASQLIPSGYNKLSEHYRDRLAKTLMSNLPEKIDDRFLTVCVEMYWKAKAQPKEIIAQRDGADIQLLQAFQILSKKKDDERGLLAEQINSYIKQTVEFSQTASLSNNKQSEILFKIQEFQTSLQKKIDQFQVDEKQLALEPTDFSAFQVAIDEFTLFDELWSIVSMYQSFQPVWLSQGDFMNINPEDVTKKTQDWLSNLQKLNKNFTKLGRGAAVFTKAKEKDRPACAADAAIICQDVMQSIDNFMIYIPLIEALRNPGLKPSHWMEVSNFTKTGKQIASDQQFTLQQLLDEGLMEEDKLENVIRISELATRQSMIDQQLLKMLDDWKSIELDMKLFAIDEIPQVTPPGDPPKPPRQQKYYIVKTFDDSISLLDEQFSIIQGLRASVFGKSKEFKTRIDDHDNTLNKLQDIIDEWIKFQRLWLYLQPIFSSEDIKRQLPTETILFTEVCLFWTEITCETFNSKKVWQFSTKDNVTQKFEVNFEKLELVNKKLSSYLQSKRMSFSRFFFLADEELLQILAQTKNVENVQQHIQKCFEGIRKLTFVEKDGQKVITQIVSPEGEAVDLFKEIIPIGDADIWLLEIEQLMKVTVRDLIKKAWVAYVNDVENGPEQILSADPLETLMGPRELWLSQWPAQVVNVLSQMVWTYETQHAIDNDAVLLQLQEQNARIDRLVLWVGCTPETVKQYPDIIYNKGIRTLLTTLLTLWVHNRDIVSQLKQPGVDHNFLFASQLKYYFKENTGDLTVKQVDASLEYQFEYLGNHQRLAITPLTDRCFLTLTSALAKTFGGSPMGPAGTGKSESVKDLAKSLAIGCYIFNCSEGLNEQSISKFFCGLCICGMYSCLDEFNRCRLDVLSVVASQILTIQRAIRSKLKAFTFEGNHIKLVNCCGIFITMNPGYAGRAELPTNLKNLFRPIYMTVPDYTIIAEILLFASGYRQASSLAVKICQTLKLSSEQLSKASHYDFGMRALRSILNAAARLKRLYWMEKEDILCLRAVCDVNVPKFLAADVILYNNIVSDLFMECYEIYMAKQSASSEDIYTCSLDEITMDVDAEHLLKRFIREQTLLLHLNPSEEFMEKVCQLYATMSVRHGLMNVGNTMTGKTTSVKIIAKALTQMHSFLKTKPEWVKEKFTVDAYPHFYPVSTYKINAKAITADELYGNFSEISNEWTDGILCTIMRLCGEEQNDRKLHFIVFDSPVDAIWVENLNTVLDDAKRLCLTSGEVIALPETTTCMFEVQNLEHASPATVSRCGMIYYDQTVIQLPSMFYAVCFEMLPKWFLELDINLQSSWPVVNVKKNVPIIQGYQDLSVVSKSQPDNNIILNSHQSMKMTVIERLTNLFNWLFIPIHNYVTKNSKTIVFQTAHTMIYNLVRILSSYIKSYSEPQCDITITDNEAIELRNTLPPLGDIGSFVDSSFIFAFTWSVGASGDFKGRQCFSQILRHLFYDIPQLLISNGANANYDFTMPEGKSFSNSSIKMTKSSKDGIELRGSELADIYKRLIQEDITIWRTTINIPFTEELKTKGDLIKYPHDVCIQVIEDKNSNKERVRGLQTPFDVAKGLTLEWVPWKHSKYQIPEPELNNIAFYSDTIIPTQDVVSLNALISFLCSQQVPILLAGPSGSGKTSLARLLMTQDYYTVKCCLTAKTSTTQFRSIVDSKLEKVRKGVYSLSKIKQSIFFVDDAHMPQKETYDAQPPLEVVRELLEEKGWYDIEQGIFKKITNTTTIMSATTTGELLDLLPSRLMHHVALISVPESSDDAFSKIFTRLIQPFVGHLPSSLSSIIDNIVSSTILLYRKVRDQFKPTPAHMHYLFGPRDLSKVFQGLLLTMKNTIMDDNTFKQYFSSQQNVVGVWVNECLRIFSDRLINDEDNRLFVELLQESWNQAGLVNTPLERILPESVFDSTTNLIEMNFSISLMELVDKKSQEDAQLQQDQQQKEAYTQIPYQFTNINDQDQRVASTGYFENAIQIFNKGMKFYDANEKLDLILFKYALTHLMRITRILQSDRGHGLMIGMPSSGKRSLTRLAAAALADFYVNSDDVISESGIPLSKSAVLKLFEPNGKGDFLDKIRQAVKVSGVQAKPCLLMIQEALADNFGLECINFLISLGEIPNLFSSDDLTEINKDLAEQFKGASKPEMYASMADRVIRNLHIVISVTPGSSALDSIVTYFPSLLGSLTVNWFTPWEEDTLSSIAQYYLKNETDCQKISQILVQIHRDTERIVLNKYPTLCTSPATFLSLISNFLSLKEVVIQRYQAQLNRYANGVQCLKDTELSVVGLRQEQTAQQPILQKAQQDVSVLAKQIDEKRKEMSAVKEVLSSEEQVAMKAKSEADVLAASCQEDLDRAQPLIDRATKALSLLKSGDVNEVRSFAQPSKGVRLLGEVLCIIRETKINTAPDADNWAIAKKVLMANGFLNILKSMTDLTAPVAQKLGKYIQNPEFIPKEVAKASAAAAGICEWIHALYEYYVVMIDVKPKQAKLAEALAQAKQMTDALEEKQKLLRNAEAQLEVLEAEAQKASEELSRLSVEYEKCCSRLKRAEGLISGLSGEQVRWNQEVIKIQEQINQITPTTIVATAYCACLGGMEFADRDQLSTKWIEVIIQEFMSGADDKQIQEIMNFKLQLFVSDQPTISKWLSNGLSKDSFSLTSASIAFMAKKVPLLIDPQQTGKKWASITLVHKESTVTIARYTDQNLHKQIETALRCGYSLIIEGIGNEEWIRNDPKMKSAILAHNLLLANIKQVSVTVKFGETEITVPNTFRLCLITTFDIAIPSDVFGDFSIVTFKATREALMDLLISVAVECENPEAENSRKQLQSSIAESQSELLELETNLLNILSSGSDSGSSLLDNVNLMNALNNTQSRSQEISRKMVKAAQKTAEIEEARQVYSNLSSQAATLFFVVLRLTNLDSMYENSLQNYIKSFVRTINENLENEAEDRLVSIFNQFAIRIYSTVSRGLFVSHKLTFSLDIAISLDLNNGVLTQQQFDIIMAAFSGNIAQYEKKENPENKYRDLGVPDVDWKIFATVCSTNLLIDLNLESADIYIQLLKDNPQASIISSLSYMVFCSCIKSRDIIFATKKFITERIGPQFVLTESPQLTDIVAESINTVPTLILLSADSDPSNKIMQLGDQNNVFCHSVSIGKGQGPIAEKAITEAIIQGQWVLLGNTHLAGTWLTKLESICESISDNSYDPDNSGKIIQIHQNFRLFLTTMPFDGFPSSIIKAATKVSAEAPMGIKNNFGRLFNTLTEDQLSILPENFDKKDSEEQQVCQILNQNYRRLLWNLSIFFSAVLERRRFGAIGFSTGYDWADPDFLISQMQLSTLFKDLIAQKLDVIHHHMENTISALKFLISSINAGGRVADSKDQLIVNSMMDAYYHSDLKKLGDVVEKDYGFQNIQKQEGLTMLDTVITSGYSRFSDLDIPELFGLDNNASILLSQNTGKQLLLSVLSIYASSSSSSSSSSSTSQTDVEYQQLQTIIEELPQPFDQTEIDEKYPTSYLESMNTVLTQECARYNKLIALIRFSSQQTQHVLKGLILKTQQTNNVLNAMRLNKVPAFWEKAAWPSLKSLSTWMTDLTARVNFIRNWVETGVQKTVWFSGFSYPQAFITGTLQNFARRQKIPIDQLVLDFEIFDILPEIPEGCQIITGMFLQGGRLINKKLVDAESGQLFVEVPFIMLKPCKISELNVGNRYRCPSYRTTARKGVLTTTGHSSNYILDIYLHCEGDIGKWVRRGAALFQQSD
ncbi:Dynein heavy chain [Spironucleus salmonicida]|uniref:Dynein heavy chain n=1 Tax=Spironucleus salmonicida TaxID=348837 RepID=V6LUK7_9EUKA|nr:Dynein heavy chain [Spironucleus salmonicida]|eukprot:EST48250.1 Dynein heavy chain [Spironucleus salmonicida]